MIITCYCIFADKESNRSVQKFNMRNKSKITIVKTRADITKHYYYVVALEVTGHLATAYKSQLVWERQRNRQWRTNHLATTSLLKRIPVDWDRQRNGPGAEIPSGLESHEIEGYRTPRIVAHDTNYRFMMQSIFLNQEHVCQRGKHGWEEFMCDKVCTGQTKGLTENKRTSNWVSE